MKARLFARQLRSTPTDAEIKLWRCLRMGQLANTRFRRQHPVDRFVLDFACPSLKLAIELDGGQHVERAKQDDARTLRLNTLGYVVLRFWNDDVLLRTEAVLEQVQLAVERRKAEMGKQQKAKAPPPNLPLRRCAPQGEEQEPNRTPHTAHRRRLTTDD